MVTYLFVEHDLAGIWLINTSEYLDQGGFTCPVLAYQGMHLASPQRKIHIVEGLDTGVVFINAFHAQDFCA